MPVTAALRWFVPDRLDLYTLRHLAGPLLLSLATLLLAQLLERLLRLFDLAASSGAPLDAVLRMAANLVPHYLGLAVPTALTAGIFMAVARLGDDNELDVMLAAGRSIARIAMPYFGLALGLSLFNLYLYGYLQPLTRYGYHVAAHEALQSGWDARVEENRFIEAGGGFAFSADKVQGAGRQLQGVFVEREDQGVEEITTARSGRLVPSADGRRLLLELDDGLIVRENADASVSLVRFEHGRIDEDFSAGPPPFRERGNLRELTLAELWRAMRTGDSDIARSRLAGEFHGRLARAFSLPLLPLLALPLGMASKRGRRAPGVVFAVFALLALNHALQFGESLAESGRAAALPAVWSPVLVFALLSIWLFRSSLRWPGDNPVIRAVGAIETAFEGVGRRKRVRRKP